MFDDSYANSFEDKDNYSRTDDGRYYENDIFSSMYFSMIHDTSDIKLEKILDRIQKRIKVSQIQASYYDDTEHYLTNQRRDLFRIKNLY